MHIILTIVVAAGAGRRMGGEVPKQFLLLGGEPIVMRTLRRMALGVERALADCSQNVNGWVHKLVLVLPEAYIERWGELCREHRFEVPHGVVAGGETRFQSVRRGLEAEPGAEVVLVHDGVRPFVSDGVIRGVIEGVRKHGAVVPVVSVVDSLRRIVPEGASVAVERGAYRAVQTPQGFRGALLREAYGRPEEERFTDDASVAEALGGVAIGLVEGDRRNIKITTGFDLAVAEKLLSEGWG
ncbi:2-C-methyl-D-erythritol 4-phosphate cytidylyltransferase [uncultured Rikenella sp.]|uniref:IspD/TarI family cytidylyltransferase n=1 Tax=uncultured Rikenella sp. TaxID=368003 RepID=UPI0025F41726|nr:2-C-methyl-D-erythritol 4-phosphate cytidylyltransferase [uncultured Rikenella sp.]